MENKEKEYEEIKLSNIKKSFRKKCCSYMSNFNKERDLSQDNSNIKCNQINVIEKYGILYFFNEEGIYFLDNSKMKVLLELNKDISYSDLFFLKCKNIFKVESLEEDIKTFLVICTKKDTEDSQSFIIYIDIEEFIEKINKQKNIYDTKIIEIIEKKEKNLKSGLVRRELEELDRNIELNEDGEYPEDAEFEPKKETLKEKEKKIKEEKEKILIERDEIFQNSFEKAAKYEPFKIIYIEDIFKEIIILDEDNYIILYENGDIIFYNNYKKIRLIQKDAQLISYNKETSIFLIISHDYLYILKENNNFEKLKETSKFPIEDIILDEKNILIFCENIYNYIILYTIQNSDEPDSSDNLIFIELDEQMKEIKKLFMDKDYFYPDDYELSGIAYCSQLKRAIISSYDKDLGIYMIFNKHMNKLNKYYIFEENKDNNNIYDLFSINIDDEFQVNSFVKKNEENEESEKNNEENEEENEEEEDEYAQKLENNNSIIGVSLIKFKFDGYDKDQEFIGGEMINSPYLLFVLGFYGGIRIHYSSNANLIRNKTDFFTKAKNISNKVLEISINEEMVEIEKEKYKNENIQKEKSFTELNNLKKLNQRNIFLHGLDQQIKENLEYFRNLAIPEKIQFQLMELQKIANNPNIKEIQNSIDLLIKEAKDLFEKEEENQKFIDDNKILIENFKNVEINLKNDIKIIEENKNKTKEIKYNINMPINELLIHPKVKNFFTEEKIIDMIKIFNKYKNNYNLYENHINLISGMFVVNDNLIKQIEECKTKYNSIKDACKFSKNRKDIESIMANLQNSIFLLYMRVFEQFFFNLEQFEINNLSKEYLYLNQLKTNYEMSIEESKNGEEEEEKINRSHARFVLKDEEDIDEGNNNSISSNELEENIISTQKKNKIITFNKNINNNSINNSINNSLNNSRNNEKEQNLIVRNNKINFRDITMNNDNYLVNREAYNTINKIFGTSLIKEKEASKKNYLIDVLNNFEGRITYYNEETEKDFCTDAEDLFQEFLEDEEEIQKRQLKEKAIKEMHEKKKENLIKNLEDSISKQKLEKDKIEKELSLIDEKNKKLIIEKEKENATLKQKFEELEKIFEDYKKEREKEKKKYMEEIEKNKKDEKQKLINEQNSANSKIKSIEEEIKNLEKKLKEEESKRIEAEEKAKKLEEEKKNINTNINLNNNNNNNDNNNNTNITNKSNDSNNNNLINFTFHENNEQNQKEEEKNKPNENKVPLFQRNNPKPDTNIFAQKINNNENNLNIQNKGNSIFDSIQNINAKKEEKTTTNNIEQNIFTSSSNNNLKEIFKANTNKINDNIFQNNSIQTLSINNKTLTNNQNQNEQKKIDNNIFSKLSTNNNEGNSSSNFFKNINFGPAIQNNINNNNTLYNQPLFGQHAQLGNQQNNNNINNNNNNKSISLNFNTGGNNASNSISPFVSFGAGNNNIFNQQSKNNFNINNNNNNNNEFF